MQQQTTQRTRKRRRFHGICRDAETLQVHRSSLYRVLTGEWKIPGLLARYEALKKGTSK